MNRNTETDNRPKTLPKGAFVAMGFLTAYLLVFTAVSDDLTALLAVVLSLAFTFIFLRVRAGVLLAVIYAVLWFGLGSLQATAELVSTTLIIGFGAMAIMSLKPIVSILLGVASFGVALILSGDLMASLYMLLPLPSAILMAVLTARRVSRNTVICAVAGIMLAANAVPLVIYLYQTYGGLGGDTLLTFINDLHAGIVNLLTETYDLVIAAIPEAAGQTQDIRSLFPVVAEMFIGFLPGGILVSVAVPAYLANTVAAMVCRASGFDRSSAPAAKYFSMSKVSAVVFFISLIVTSGVMFFAFFGSFFGSSVSPLTMYALIIAGNVQILLIPGFSLTGIAVGIHFIRQNRGCATFLMIAVLLLIGLYASALVLYPIALTGAFHVFRSPALSDVADNQSNS